MAPKTPPRATVKTTTSGIGTPALASSPATIPQTESCEPIEMSICRARITSVMPAEATSTGALATSIERNLSPL
jgi:hypothetical protein